MRRTTTVFCAALASAAFMAAEAKSEPLKITILQINDFDDMDGDDGQGGFARLAAILEAENAASENVLFVHAGDAISPSLLSGFDNGAHMIDLLNQTPLDVFAPGNHEFDFGPEIYLERAAQAEFDWIASNVKDASGAPLGGLPTNKIIEIGDFALGFFALLTPTTAVTSSPGDTSIDNVLDVAADQSAALREAGADLVIAVTHTSVGEDLELFAQGAADLILTGHDHDVRVVYDGRTAMVESGSQADYVTAIDLTLDRVERRGEMRFVWSPAFRVLNSADYAPNEEAAALVASYEEKLSAELDVDLGPIETELDSRRAVVRGEEAAIGNLIADAMREAVDADFGFTNGGGIRGDRIYEVGHVLTRRDIQTELPFGNKTVKLVLTGADVVAALENGFSQVEDGSGRFPQISGLMVEADLTREPGMRVVSVMAGGAPIDPDATYTLATNDYVAKGGDGYAMFADLENLIDPAAAQYMASQVMDYVAARGGVAPEVEGRMALAR